MNGRMIMAMNIHREICGAVMGGGVSLESDQVHYTRRNNFDIYYRKYTL